MKRRRREHSPLRARDRSAAPQHLIARRWLEDAFSGDEPVRLPWSVIHTFLRITTGRTLLTNPYDLDEAITIVNQWIGLPVVQILEPGPRYWRILTDLMISGQARGDLVPDAHIAALALENGASVCTADRDFRRFDGLKVINPLA